MDEYNVVGAFLAGGSFYHLLKVGPLIIRCAHAGFDNGVDDLGVV